MEQVLRPEDLNKVNETLTYINDSLNLIVNETLKDMNESLNLIAKAIRELEPFLTDIKKAIVYK